MTDQREILVRMIIRHLGAVGVEVTRSEAQALAGNLLAVGWTLAMEDEK